MNMSYAINKLDIDIDWLVGGGEAERVSKWQRERKTKNLSNGTMQKCYYNVFLVNFMLYNNVK